MSKPNKKGRGLLRRLVLVLAAGLLGLSIYRWNATRLLGDQLPMPLGFGVATVLSGSMEPTLRVDDLVFIRQTDSVQPDDIVIYQQGGSLVIHRVIALEADTLYTKGDANNAPDQPIPLAAVKGVLAFSIPAAGRLVHLLRQPLVVAAILAAAVLLTELSFRKEKQKDTQELETIEEEIRQLLAEMKEE